MRVTIRAKLIAAFLFVSGMSVIVATVIPLHMATSGIAKENDRVINNQEEKFDRKVQDYRRVATVLAREIKDKPGIVEAVREERWTEASRRGQELIKSKTGTPNPETPPGEAARDPLRFEVFILPPQRTRLLADQLKQATAEVWVRSADLGAVNGRKVFGGALDRVLGAPPEDGGERPLLAGVFVGFPLIEDALPPQPRKGMFQEPGQILSVIQRSIPDLILEFAGPEAAPIQEWLEAHPTDGAKLLEEREKVSIDNFPLLDRIWQVELQPIVAPGGEVISIRFFAIERPRFLAVWGSIQKNFVIAAVVSSILAIIFAIFISKTVVRPIRMLSRRALAVAGGQLDQPARVHSHDEIGDLATAFNTMQEELRRTLGELKRRAETIEHQNVQLDHSLHELSRMKDYTENVLQSVRVGVVTFDRDRKITKINDTAVRILEAEGEDIEEVETHLSQGPLQSILEMGLAEGKTVTDDEIELSTFGGGRRPVEVTSGLLLRQGEVIGLVVSYRDLAQMKSLQEQVRRQDRLASLGHLSAGVAHEIRNPLAIIKGSAEILRRRFHDKDGEEGLTDSIIEEVNRLSKVVSNFLDFARPKEPTIVEDDLNRIVRKALALAEHHRSGGGVRVNTRLAEDLPSVPIDPEQCEQVFLNLILNALESMKDGGVLIVRSRMEGEMALVEIQDTGEGIDPKNLENIFDPFFTSKEQGTGLGLSVVHMIVTAHRGRIEVESEWGRGSIFRIFFPVSGDDVKVKYGTEAASEEGQRVEPIPSPSRGEG